MLQLFFRRYSAIVWILALAASSKAASVEPRETCTDDEIPVELELFILNPNPVSSHHHYWYLRLPEFSISDAQDNTVYFDGDDVYRHADYWFNNIRKPQYVSLNLCLPKDKCYHFFRSGNDDNDYHQLNVTIDGERVDLSSESPIQVVEFGAYSCKLECDEFRGESVMDMYIYRWDELWGDRLDISEMTWMLSNADTDTFLASGKAKDIEFAWKTNFLRMCVKADACHKLSLLMPPPPELGPRDGIERGSYLVVLDGVVYGEKKYSLGNQIKFSVQGSQYEDSLLFGPSCSSAVCPLGDSFLEIAATVSANKTQLRRGERYSDLKTEVYPDPITVEQRNDIHNVMLLRNFDVPMEYKYYDCMDITNITCVTLNWFGAFKPELFDGSLDRSTQVAFDGEEIVMDNEPWRQWILAGCSEETDAPTEAPKSGAPGNGVQLSSGIAATMVTLVALEMCSLPISFL